MGLLNRGRRKTDDDKFAQAVAYDNISKGRKLENIVMLYDEKSILLFEKPLNKTNIKKV